MHRLPSLLAVLAAATPLSAGASVVVAMDLAELCGRAELIAHGKALRQDSAWENGRIITRTVVRLHGALKGLASKEIVVRRVGGVVDGVGQILHGEASLEPGEEVVLFLRPVGAEYRTVGMAQGKFKIVTDPRTGKSDAVQELGGLALAKRKGPLQKLDISHAGPLKLPARELFSKVTELVARPRPEVP